jgi:hypothetical protein
MMVRGTKNNNEAVKSVLTEAEENLTAAFLKSKQTLHPVLKGNARAASIADVLSARLPKVYTVSTCGEVVDYKDSRSGEIDILIHDQHRNAIFSADPLWVPAESLLAYIEVKTCLTKRELEKAFIGAKKISALKPFKKAFNLNIESESKKKETVRCFRTIFAYDTDLTEENWLLKEWDRIKQVSKETKSTLENIDRVLVLNRGMLNLPSRSGIGKDGAVSAFHQWFVNLVNFLDRESERRSALDWQQYSAKNGPGWQKLSV